MLDTRRIEIDFFAGFEVDARCRVFPAGSYEPIPCHWPYVTLTFKGISFSLKAPEVCVLSFLGPDGCEDIFRELYSQDVFKGHPRIKEIALGKGISQWAVIEAARRHHSRFRSSMILSRLQGGRFDQTMWLHRVTAAPVQHYDIYEVESARRDKSFALFDHVVTVEGAKYRCRMQGSHPLAAVGEKIDFLFRKDAEGGRFLILSSISRTSENGLPS